MHIVLIEPEIPGNTGNIARLCAVSGIELHLVKPLGFSVEDKYLKRAGLDYWHLVKVHYHENFSEVLRLFAGRQFYYCSKKRLDLTTPYLMRKMIYLFSARKLREFLKLCLKSTGKTAFAFPCVPEHVP